MPRLQVNVEGTLAGGLGAWAVTAQYSVPSLPANQAAMDSLCTTIRATLAASTPFKASIGIGFSMVSVKALAYPVPVGPVSFVGLATGTPVPGTLNQGVPPQNCVVVSERTPGAGASYRGRTYWPFTVLDATGLVNSTDAGKVVAGWMALHNAILAALTGLSISGVRVVFSRKTGEMTPINTIGIGSRSDIIRHRKAQGPESYTWTAMPTSFAVTPAEVGGAAAGLEGQDFLDYIEQNGLLQVRNLDDVVNEKLGINITDFIPIPTYVEPPPEPEA